MIDGARWRFAVSSTLVALSLAVTTSCSGESATDARSDRAGDAAVILAPERVLLAAIVLTVGDLERALEAGVVTPDELDVASRELAADTLDDWWERSADD